MMIWLKVQFQLHLSCKLATAMSRIFRKLVVLIYQFLQTGLLIYYILCGKKMIEQPLAIRYALVLMDSVRSRGVNGTSICNRHWIDLPKVDVKTSMVNIIWKEVWIKGSRLAINAMELGSEKTMENMKKNSSACVSRKRVSFYLSFTLIFYILELFVPSFVLVKEYCMVMSLNAVCNF